MAELKGLTMDDYTKMTLEEIGEMIHAVKYSPISELPIEEYNKIYELHKWDGGLLYTHYLFDGSKCFAIPSPFTFLKNKK